MHVIGVGATGFSAINGRIERPESSEVDEAYKRVCLTFDSCRVVVQSRRTGRETTNGINVGSMGRDVKAAAAAATTYNSRKRAEEAKMEE